MHEWNERAAAYLRKVVSVSKSGGACNVYPFEVFEKAWVLARVSDMRGEGLDTSNSLSALASMWRPDGVSFTSQGMVSDCDDTAMALKVLRLHGRAVDPT